MVINAWTTNRGDSPVEEFIREQEPKAQSKILKDLDHFERQGLKLLFAGKLKKLRGCDLYELKTWFAGVYYRILICIKSSGAWLLTAFKKKSNKTPQGQIKLALSRASTIV